MFVCKGELRVLVAEGVLAIGLKAEGTAGGTPIPPKFTTGTFVADG